MQIREAFHIFVWQKPLQYCKVISLQLIKKKKKVILSTSMNSTLLQMGFPCGSAGKESACNVGDLGSTPELEDPLEKGKATHSSILAWGIP